MIGVPLRSSMSVLDGLDALLSIVQMPPGVPVAAVGVDNSKNAAVLAARILARPGWRQPAVRPPLDCRRDRPLLPARDEPDLVGRGEAGALARRGARGPRRLGRGRRRSRRRRSPRSARARCRRRPQRVAELEQTTDHDLAAFVDAVAEQLGPGGPVAALRAHVVRRRRHRARAPDPGRRQARPRRDRPRARGGRRARRGAPPLDLHRPLARDPRGADDVRLEARRLGVRARPRTGRGSSQALETNRVGQLSGTVGTYGALEPEVERIACERLGLEPDPLSTQVISRDRHAELLAALAIVATSLDRFATEIRHLARTEVREVEEPFATGMKGSSAMPHKRNPKVAERISGLARIVRADALVGLENMPLWHERDISHSSAERVVIPDSFLALDYMLDRFALARRRPRRRIPSGCSRNLERVARARLLAPAAARARRVGSRPRTRHTGSCSGTRCARGTRSATSASSSRRTRRSSSRLDADRARGGVRPACDRPARRRRVRAAARRSLARGGVSMSETPTHVASGKVRELYRARRRPSAARRERPHLDVRRRAPDGDPRQGPRPHRASPASGSRGRRRSSRTTCSALRDDGRSTECRRLEMLPIECVVRGYLAGSGWKDYARDRRGLRAPAPGRARRVGSQLPEPIFTPATKAQTGHDENIDRAAAVALVGEERYRRGRAAVARALPASRPSTPRRAGSSSPTRSSSSALDEQGRLVLADEAFTPDSSRFWPADEYVAGEAAAVVRQAVRPRLLRVARLGQDVSGPGAARERRRRHAHALRRGVRAADRDCRSTSTSPGPEVVLG